MSINRNKVEDSKSDLWYFAYGSSMDEGRLRNTYGVYPKYAEKAALHDWVLAFTKIPPAGRNWGKGILGLPNNGFRVRPGEGFSSIDHKKGGLIEGTLYRITEEDAKILDKWEGEPGIDDNRQSIEITRKDGSKVDGYTYRSLNRVEGLKPSREYMFTMVLIATRTGLSEKYINYLANIETL